MVGAVLMPTYYYVCDRCSAVDSRPEAIPEDGVEWTCASCHSESHAAWEFTDKRKALQHSSDIRQMNRSRLFRAAR